MFGKSERTKRFDPKNVDQQLDRIGWGRVLGNLEIGKNSVK